MENTKFKTIKEGDINISYIPCDLFKQPSSNKKLITCKWVNIDFSKEPINKDISSVRD